MSPETTDSTDGNFGTILVPLLKGEYIDVRVVNSQTVGADALNNISIYEVGEY